MLLHDIEAEVARFRRVVVHDPGRRLPANLPAFPGLTGSLVVPDRGAPIHPESIKRFAEAMRQDEPLAWAPTVPNVSGWGLPTYPALLYWVPTRRPTLQDLVPRMRRGYQKMRSGQLKTVELPQSPRQLGETSVDEQVHYFATHFGAVSQKPIQVSVVVLNTCNLECVMCPYHSPQIKATHTTGYFDEKQAMTWDHMQRIAAECGRLQIPVKMGNIEEPLLHPRLTDFIKLCREKGVPTVHITTNGTILTERIARGLIEAGLTSMYISMDAARPDTYKRIRGGDLVKLEANVRTMLRLRRETGAKLRILTSFIRNHGVTEEEEQEFRDRWNSEADGTIFYNLAEYAEKTARFDQINRVTRQLMEKMGRWSCIQPFVEIYILPDGEVLYCCETVAQLAFDDVEPIARHPVRGIPDIWLGDAFTKLRRDLLRNELSDWRSCENCGIWGAHISEAVDMDGMRVTRNMITEIFEPKR
jgi:MoaA/NifB/PqqE/SkfB family radical SAM enzyme